MLMIFRPCRVGHKVQVGGNTGTVRELSLFWTELVTDDKVLIIVPNSGVWGQALRNFSVYPVLHAGEARIRIGEDTVLDSALAKVRVVVEAHSRVLADPAPSVLLDRNATDNALEIVIGFSTVEDEIATVKSDLIKAVHDGLGHENATSWRPRRQRRKVAQWASDQCARTVPHERSDVGRLPRISRVERPNSNFRGTTLSIETLLPSWAAHR
jgi:small-conductance mechanosensitive channel